MEQIEIRKQVERFLDEWQRREWSKPTRNHYRYILELVFLPWCEAEGITDATLLNGLRMERFIESLRNRVEPKPLSVPSIRTYVRAVRTFLGFLEVPVGKVRLPKERLRLREVLTRNEIDAMERAAIRPRKRPPTAFEVETEERNALMVRILADTGLRVGELLSLRVTNLRKDTATHRYFLRVIGKGGDEREVGLSRENHSRLMKLGEGHVFIFRGEGERPLTKSGAEQIIRKLAKRAKIGRRIWPHLFRHSWVTQQIRAGKMSLIDIQKTVGHKSLAMVSRIYSHTTAADSYDAMLAGLRS